MKAIAASIAFAAIVISGTVVALAFFSSPAPSSEIGRYQAILMPGDTTRGVPDRFLRINTITGGWWLCEYIEGVTPTLTVGCRGPFDEHSVQDSDE